MRINILLPIPHGRAGEGWGEYPYALSLQKAFAAEGVTTRIYRRARFPFIEQFSLRRGIDLSLGGRFTKPARIWPWVTTIVWAIGHPHLSKSNRKRARHILVGSPSLAAKWKSEGLPASVMLQCTDTDICSPDKAEAGLATDVLFVGSWRGNNARNIVHHALAAGFVPKVWGGGWDKMIGSDLVAGKRIPNPELGRHYASAKVVLNDHQPFMLKDGFISNRAFDVLACGAELVTDQLPDLGIPLHSVHLARNADEVGLAIAEALRGYEERRTHRLDVAEYIRKHHGFANRVRTILDVIASVRSPKR